MYKVLFVYVYILVTKHDIFQINMSLIRQNSEISKSIRDSETEKAPTRLRDIKRKPPSLRDYTTIFRTPDFKGTIRHSQIKARGKKLGHSRLNV